MKVGIGSDHGGFGLKEELAAQLRRAGHEVVDLGAHYSADCLHSSSLCGLPWSSPNGISHQPRLPTLNANALNVIHSQVNWLQNKTRTASNLAGEQGCGSLRHEFEVLRLAYDAFARTLTPQQVERGAKVWWN